MSFSGAWMRSQGPFAQKPGPLLHTADPAHADTTEVDANAWSYTAPEGTNQGGIMPDNEWMGQSWYQPDMTPYDDHAVGPNTRPRYSDAYTGVTGIGGGNLSSQTEAAKDAGKYYGDPSINAYASAPFQFSGETYDGHMFQSFGPLPISDDANRRGGNSDPANNPPIDGQPDGFRRGDNLLTWLDRKLYFGRRNHDRAYLSPNDAEPPTDQTRGTGTNAYLSPFDSATRVVTRVFNTPERIQEPPDFSESITVDPDATPNQVDNFPEHW